MEDTENKPGPVYESEHNINPQPQSQAVEGSHPLDSIPQAHLIPDILDAQKQCACQICLSGNHHEHPRPKVKDIYTSSYKEQFKPYIVIPTPPRRSTEYTYRHYGPDELKSNYQQQYIPKPLVNNDELFRNRSMIVDNSETSSRQLEKETEHSKSIRSSHERFQNVAKRMILPTPKFQGVSSYKDQFKGYLFEVPMTERSNYSNLDNAGLYKKSSPRFQGISSYKSTFVPLPMENKPLIKEYRYNTVPFRGESTYKSNFPTFRIELQQPNPEVRANPGREVPKLDDKTTYKEHFENTVQVLNIRAPIQLQMPKKQQEKQVYENKQVPESSQSNQRHLRYDVVTNRWL